MAFTGQILDNPISGERFIFSQTSADTGGELVAVEFHIDPKGKVPGAHVHPMQEERFEVVSGVMRFKVGRKHIVAGPGEILSVEPGTPHKFENYGDERAVLRVEVRPALRIELLWETATALAEEGRTFRNGMPKPLELAMFMHQFEHEVRAPFAPGLVRLTMLPLLAAARSRGLDQRYTVAPRVPAYA
jgi:quercetin dioxygenase-like cupin family protein